MADDKQEDNNSLELDAMPGADRAEPEPETSVDLNFGLGEEDAESDPEEDADTSEEAVEQEEADHNIAEVDEEAVAENEADEPEAVSEEQPSLSDETDTVAESETAEPAAETEQPAPKKPMVPKARLDEVLAKQKALQKQLDDLKAAQADMEAPEAPEEYDFAAKEVEYQNMLLDGEADKAAQLRSEIRGAERQQIEFELTQKVQQSVHEGQQQTALQQAATELEASFPVFSQGSADYSAELTQEVIDLRDAFIIKGDNAVAALSKAANFVLRDNNLVDMSESSPALSDSKAAEKRSVDEVSKKRAEVSRKLKAAEAQPPELPGESSASRGEQLVDVDSMSEEEFNALPEATLKRLRGDIV